MMRHSSTLVVLGSEYELSVETVEVIATEAKSNTRVFGGGYTIVTDGEGFGVNRIDSSVEVSRNIFYRREDGTEGHWVSDFDLPVRVGHHLLLHRIKGPRLVHMVPAKKSGWKASPREALLVSVEVLETKRSFNISGWHDGAFVGLNPEPYHESALSLIVIGSVLVPFGGLGFAVLLYALFRRPLHKLLNADFGISKADAIERVVPARKLILTGLENLATEARQGFESAYATLATKTAAV